jgi:hypothetical protein
MDGHVFNIWKQEISIKYLFVNLEDTVNSIVFWVAVPSSSERAYHF